MIMHNSVTNTPCSTCSVCVSLSSCGDLVHLFSASISRRTNTCAVAQGAVGCEIESSVSNISDTLCGCVVVCCVLVCCVVCVRLLVVWCVLHCVLCLVCVGVCVCEREGIGREERRKR